jgi:hypothetical protein
MQKPKAASTICYTEKLQVQKQGAVFCLKKYKNFILDQFPFFIDESANLSYKNLFF